MVASTPRIDRLEDPTQLPDDIATKLGLKVYSADMGTGTAGPDITVGFSTFTDRGSQFIPYQMQDGNWRMRFNISVRAGTTSSSSEDITLTGVTFANPDSTFRQPVNVRIYNSSSSLSGYGDIYHTNPGLSTISVNKVSPGTTWNHLDISGDVALDAKPTWAA